MSVSFNKVYHGLGQCDSTGNTTVCRILPKCKEMSSEDKKFLIVTALIFRDILSSELMSTPRKDSIHGGVSN